MKRFLCCAFLCCAFLLVLSQFAVANSKTHFNVATDISIYPNQGDGGNMGFALSGPGVFLAGSGGTGDNFSGVGVWFNPGDSLTPGAGLFFEQVGGGHVGNVQYNPNLDNIQLGQGLGVSATKSFVFPNTGQPFSITLPIKFDDSLYAWVGVDQQHQQLDYLNLGHGKITIDFAFGPTNSDNICAVGTYCMVDAEITTALTPEPNAILLLGTGLIALVALRKLVKA